MSRTRLSILAFGSLLAVLAVVMQFVEYRYYVGGLATDVYTFVVAFIFTAIGIWIGIELLRKRKVDRTEKPEINLEKLSELSLNEREYEILKLISEGHSNQDIADQLFLALPTVKTHISNLYSKMDVQSRTQAVFNARLHNLI